MYCCHRIISTSITNIISVYLFYASYDFDSVAHVVESLSAYRIPEDEVTRYELLVKAVDNYDYDLIPGILDRGKE